MGCGLEKERLRARSQSMMDGTLVDPVPIVSVRVDARLPHLFNTRCDRLSGMSGLGALSIVREGPKLLGPIAEHWHDDHGLAKRLNS